MRRFLFMCGVALITGISLAAIISNQERPRAVDPLTEIEKSLLGWSDLLLSESGSIVTEKSETSRSIVMLDGLDNILIGNNSPVPQIGSGATREIQLSNGLYLFSLGNIFSTSVIRTETLKIEPLATGIFFVDVRPEVTRVYASTTPLKISIINKDQTLTDIRLFPLWLLVHNPSFNEELRGADMFRVAQIDTLQNIDLLADGGGKLIFGPRASEAQLLLSSFQKYLKGRDATFHAFYKNFTPQKSGLLDNIEEYGLIFVNDTKKQAILRNSLIYRLQAILLSNKEKCDAGCKKERSARISEVRSILTKADTLSPEFGKDLRSILQRYVLLGLTSTESRPTTYFAEGQSSIGELANMILSPSSGSTTRYRLLSEIFNEYVVAGGTRAQLDENMQGFIRILITGKTLEEADFLPLVFYINEYLSLKNDDIDSTALSMANSMVTLAGRYLETRNKKDEKFATLSVLFFTFSSLFERMHTHIGTRFFEGPEDRRVLKKEYQDESGARIDTDFINRYEELLLILEKFNENQKDFYLASLGSASTDTTNLFDQLTRILGLHKKTLTIWKDYRLYENNLNLSDESRNIQSIVISDMESSDTIIEYISTFTGVNPTKTRIINSPESDGHFIVETEIQGVPFQFRIRGKERFLENIEFTDIAGIKQNLRWGVSLVEREKLIKEQSSSTTNLAEREKLAFKNYFIRTFLDTATPSDSTTVWNSIPVTPPRKTMTPDMLVFVEEELLSGDFKIIENTVRIPIQNVFAEIINGKYDITLTDVEFRSRGKDTTYSLSCSMKYVRTVETRAFTDLQCRVYEDDKNRGFRFEGTSFPIIPGSIPLTEFSGKMEELGKYIEQIRLNTGTNYDAVFIDFTSKSVMIRGNTFPIP